MRLTVLTTDVFGTTEVLVDVGPDEVALLQAQKKKVVVKYWGRYGPGEWAENSTEHERIKQQLG
jgi:hypothetical protein